MEKNNNKNEELDKGLNIIAKSSIVVLVGFLLAKVAAFGYRIIIANYLGAEVYGFFSLASMIYFFFISFSILGLQEGLTRYIPFYIAKNQGEKIKYIFNYSLKFGIFMSILSAILLFLLSELIAIKIFNNSGLVIFLKVFAFFIPLSTVAGFFMIPLRAYEKIKIYILLSRVFQPVMQLIVLGIFVFLGFKVLAVFFSYTIGIFGLFLVSFFVCKHYFKDLFTKVNLTKGIKSQTIKKLFSFSWPLLFLWFIVSLFTYTDSFVIGYFRNVSQVGIYNSAVPLATLIAIAPNLFTQLFFPLIVKNFARKKNILVRELSKQVAKWIFLLNLPLVLIMVIFPGAILNLFFKPEYVLAANSLRFLSIGMFIYSLSMVSENLLSMAGKSKIILVNIASAFILNLILNIILVPNYGLSGAAFSTMVSYFFWGVLNFIQTKRHTSIIPLRRKMVSIFLVSIIPLAFLIFLKNIIPLTKISLILQGILFVLLYLLLILVTKGLDENDLMVIRSAKEKMIFRHKKKKS